MIAQALDLVLGCTLPLSFDVYIIKAKKGRHVAGLAPVHQSHMHPHPQRSINFVT